MLRLFEGSAYLRAALIWRLDAAKNCINFGSIIFRIKVTELTSFDFVHIRATVLIRRRRSLTLFSKCGAYSISALYRRRRYTVRVKLVLRGARCRKEAKWEKKKRVSALTLNSWWLVRGKEANYTETNVVVRNGIQVKNSNWSKSLLIRVRRQGKLRANCGWIHGLEFYFEL